MPTTVYWIYNKETDEIIGDYLITDERNLEFNCTKNLHKFAPQVNSCVCGEFKDILQLRLDIDARMSKKEESTKQDHDSTGKFTGEHVHFSTQEDKKSFNPPRDFQDTVKPRPVHEVIEELKKNKK